MPPITSTTTSARVWLLGVGREELGRQAGAFTADPAEKISGAIIMNDLGMEIFNSGNEAIIYQLLSALPD